MENVKNMIEKYKLISRGEIVGVGVSGGADSMALLHKLNSLADDLDFEVVALHVDHNIRENSGDDARFVLDYCKEHGIRAYKVKVDVPRQAEEKGLSLEAAAREARYGVFDAFIKKGIVDKIAVAHHMGDQAETILLNLFRGTGVSGAKGMELERDGIYIRPMLNTEKKAVLDYVNQYQIPYVEDATNQDSSYSRNFIRNEVLPLIQERWPNVVEKIVAFGKACADDDSYINSQIFDDAFISSERTIKIPNSYFLYPNAIVSRMIFKALGQIGVTADIERKHIKLIRELATSGKNGSKLDLPFGTTAIKEYDFLTLTNKKKKVITLNEPLRSGSFKVEGFGEVTVKKTKNFEINAGELLLDTAKVPETAIWRLKKTGDMFTKFGGGTKKLKDFLIDKKVPQRLRGLIPVLADGKEILAIAGLEISNKVRLDSNTVSAYKVTIKLEN